MPLPVPGTSWPPPALADLLPAFYRWSAWYSGDVDQLADAYGSTQIRQQMNRPAQFAGGVKGAAARLIWGRPQVDDAVDDDRWHVPLASDLCAATAELAYADPPQITTISQDRVQDYIDAGMFATVSGGVETGAALGGHYLQAVLPGEGKQATLQVVDYDGAWPLFRYGDLVSVAFWFELPKITGDKGVYRHFEQHELDPDGTGVIRHRLYVGGPDKIGQISDLSVRPETSPLMNPDAALRIEGADAVWSTGTPGLDVVHIPGRTPQRAWRRHPLGRNLGRSLLQGIEGPLSQLDEVYTSWMRDVRLGRSRLVVADYLLEGGRNGEAGVFNMDRALFTPLNLPPHVGEGSAVDPIRQVQFAIRMEEHRATCQEITELILRAVSYSAQTFGEDEEGNAQTATSVMSKDSRSMRTRRVNLGPERVGLQTILRKCLAMEQAAAIAPVQDDELTVTFPDGAAESPLQLAQTAQALRVAEAASTETLVRMVNPDWSDDQVATEVLALAAERSGPALADPTAPIGDAGEF